MHNKSKSLGTLVQRHPAISSGERVSNIEFWPSYGIVCPSLTTSNGSADTVARHLTRELDVDAIRRDLPGYQVALTIAGEVIPPDASEKDILDRLTMAASAA